MQRACFLLIPAATTAVALGLSASTSASPDRHILAKQQTPSLVAGGDGRLVWSREDSRHRFHLMLTQRGRTTALPIAPRTTPFDAAVGETATGQHVVVYSRCEGPKLWTLPYRSLRGCRLFQYSFRGRREEPLRVPMPSGATSAFLPTISHGNVAFAARIGRTELGLFLKLKDRRLQRVRIARPGGDDPRVGTAWGDAPGPTRLALRGDVLAYTWTYTAQRDACGGNADKLGAVPNDMLVIRRASGSLRIAVHSGCREDVTSPNDVEWIDAQHVRFIGAVPDSYDTAVCRLALGPGAIVCSRWPGELDGYATDGQGHAIGSTSRSGRNIIRTTPVLPSARS